MVVAGGIGEVYSLSVEEIVEVVKVSVEAAAGRMPVLAGAGFNAAMAGEIARRSERAGAQGLLLLPPGYANAPEAGLMAYYEAVARASELPLLGYSREWAAPSPEAVARIADRVPKLAAWKDGQGDLRRFQRIMQFSGDRLAWVGGAGDDLIPGYLAIGVQAFTSSISSIEPRLAIALAVPGASLDDLMRRCVHPLYALRERSRGYEVAVTKAAMEILGRRAGPVRPPLVDCTPRDREDIAALMSVYRDFLSQRESGFEAERSAKGAGRIEKVGQ